MSDAPLSNKPYKTTRLQTVYWAYEWYLDGYKEFTTSDMKEKMGVSSSHASAIIYRCIKSEFVVKTNEKKGRGFVFRLTKKGIHFGEILLENYNPVTRQFRRHTP